MGTAKGKQSDTETLCHPPPPLARVFSLVSSLVIYPLFSRVLGAIVLMYADDLVIIFPFDDHDGPLETVMEVLQEFGDYSGLRVNLKKNSGNSATYTSGAGAGCLLGMRHRGSQLHSLPCYSAR